MLLLVGLGVGMILVNQKQIFKPRAASAITLDGYKQAFNKCLGDTGYIADYDVDNSDGTNCINLRDYKILRSKFSQPAPTPTKTLIPTPTPVASCGADIALNKSVTASGYWGSNIPQNAVDGNDSTAWQTNSSSGAWLMVDLGDSYTLGSVKVSWAWDSGYYGTQAISKIQVSTNGLNWQDVAQSVHTPTNNSRQKETLAFNPVTARFVRFYAAQWNGGWGDVPSLEVYRSSCSNPTPTTILIPTATPTPFQYVPTPTPYTFIPTPTPTRIPTSTTPPQTDACNACSADVDRSGYVNFLDPIFIKNYCWGKHPYEHDSYGRSCAPADIYNDGIVGQNDLDCANRMQGAVCQK